MNRPLVSVIIPCYNAAAYLPASLECVLVQTYRNLEIILVNDGSTDNTDEVIGRYNDKRIRYYRQNNVGQCAASNLGWQKAKGDYIKFFDADDLMNPEHIELQMRTLRGRDDAVASCEWGAFYDGDPESARFVPEPVWQHMGPLDWLKTSLQQKGDMMGGWLWLIPRKVMESTGGWDERLSLNNDFEFSVRLLMNCERVLFTKGARFYYRLGKINSLSQHYTKDKLEQAILSTDLGCSYLLEMESSDEMRQICANRYQLWLYRIYPYHKDLVKYLENKIQSLGGSNRKMEGGRVLRMVNFFLGWKKSKKLKLLLERRGYKKLPFN